MEGQIIPSAESHAKLKMFAVSVALLVAGESADKISRAHQLARQLMERNSAHVDVGKAKTILAFLKLGLAALVSLPLSSFWLVRLSCQELLYT